jgi:hypothetical protein
VGSQGQESEEAKDKGTGKSMPWRGWSNIAGALILEDIGISGPVVECIVAIDVSRGWIQADAFCVFCDCGLVGIAGQLMQDHMLPWTWRKQLWHQFYDHGLPELAGPLDQGRAIVLSYCFKMSFATRYPNVWHLLLLTVAADCWEDW